jgi:NADP-reducing hydrogenase subunit HndA
MAKHKTAVPFTGTAEQEEQLKALIAEYKHVQGALMPVLQQAQEIYGYLPIEVQTMIAQGLDIPLEEVYGVATFYGQFTLNPKGTYQIAVCLGTACYVRGAGQVLERIEQKLKVQRGSITSDGKFSLDATRCLGACGLAPVMTINGEVFGRLVPADVDKILDQYINA